MRLAAALVLALVPLLLGSPIPVASALAQEAPAAEPPRSVWGDEAVVAVRRAHDAGDSERMTALAATLVEDVWAAAEVLWIERADDALAAFVAAAAARGDETAGLAAYVAARDPALREAAATSVVRLRDAVGMNGRGQQAQALQVLDALPTDEETVLAVRILRERGNAMWGLGRFPDAAQTFEKAAALGEKLGDIYHACRSCKGSSHAFQNAGMMPDAARVRERWLALARRVGEAPLLGSALVALATARELQGDLDAAMALAEEGAALLAEHAPNEPEFVSCLVEIGRVHRARAELAEAVEVTERALDVARASKNPWTIGLVLSNLSAIHHARGDLAAALRTAEENRALKRTAGDARTIAMADTDTGWCRFALGQWTAGITLMEDALAGALPTGDQFLIARCRTNLGAALHQMGRHERAIGFFDDAANTYGLINVPQGRADCLISKGNALMRLERFDACLAAFAEAEKIAVAIGDPSRVVQARGSRALVLGERGAFEESLAIHRAMFAAAEQANDHDSMTVARISTSEMLRRLGRLDEALEEAEASVVLAERDQALRRLIHARWGLATTLSLLERHTAAVAEARAVAEIQLAQLSALTGEEGAGAREATALTLAGGVGIAVRAGAESEAFVFAETLRAGALFEALNARGSLAAAAIPIELLNAEADVLAKLKAARSDAVAARAGGKLKAVRQAAERVAALEMALQDAVESIRRRAAVGAGVVRPAIPDEATLRAALRPGQVLVTFLPITETSHAIVTTSAGHRLVELGTPEATRAAVAALLEIDTADDPAAAIAAARKALIEPLGIPADATDVLLNTTGSLAYVPPAVLIPDRPVACVPSAAVYALLRRQEKATAADVLALGDPTYALPAPDTAVASLRSGTLRSGGLAPLPGTRAEVEAIATVKLLGEAATETGLRGALEKHAGKRLRALHLACHGLVDERHPLFSSLALTPDDENDGFLTALEVNRLPLDADLVTLSACETARGKVYRGEGVVGLTSAFLVAGARNVICSLWKVDDEATRALMTRFYALWNPTEGQGLPIAEALRQAQEHVRSDERWKHPKYWAAWQLWGAGD